MTANPTTATTAASNNAVHWQRFSVPFEYPVVFTRGLFQPENPAFVEAIARREPDRAHRLLVFVDQGLLDADPELPGRIERFCDAHRDRLDLVAPPRAVIGGERIKSELTHIEAVQDAIHAQRIDRHSCVVAIGGGAVLDAVGLAAATVHRGVRHVRVPTTVLAQNDSGVGVKNGVNLKGIKNFVGSFAPPWAVLNDFDFLDRLPARERRAGIAEAVKVALIRDGAFFEWLEANADGLFTFVPAVEERMIRRSAELHMHQIAHGGDPFETGSARPLDYGHWSAHRLESLTRGHVRHGEAVALGVALDARYSVLTGLLDEPACERIVVLLEHLGFDLWHPALGRLGPDGQPAIMRGLEEFREHLGGELTVTLLAGIGRGVEVNSIDERLMRAAADWLKARAGA